MAKTIILALVLSFATLGLQACFYQSSATGQPASTSTTCDAQGNNCQSTTTTNTSKSSWGVLF